MSNFAPLEFVEEHKAASSTQRNDWVEMQMVKNFMQDARLTMAGSMVVALIMAAVLYRAVSHVPILVWLGLLGVLIFLRYRVAVVYQRDMQGLSGALLREFLSKHEMLWALAGVLWGSSMYLFFTKSSGFEQFICTLILIGVCNISLYSFVSWLSCFFTFVNALCGTVLAVLLYLLLVEKAMPPSIDVFGLMAMTLMFWGMMRYFGARFNGLLLKSLKLQFDNDELVQSLTAKSAAAMDAIENKNRFIASAAHDLRQPVHALNLYATWLVDEPELSLQVAPQIVRCTYAVNELFNSLFDFSGLTIDAPLVNWQSVDLAALLLDLKCQYEPQAKQSGLQLRLRAPETTVTSDPVLLKRLLGNLISNALKNTRHGGVSILLRRRTGRCRVEVWDTGVGIDEAYQKAIFKEFYRVPRQGTQDGFGLGLPIAARLTQLLGHKLRMRSKLGSGSVFWLEILQPELLASQ